MPSVKIGRAIGMDFKRSSKFYLNIFYFLGLSPYHPNCPGGLLAYLVTCFKFIQATICISASIFALYYLNTNDHMTDIETIIINFYIFCDLFRANSTLLQCLCFKQHLIKVICIFDNLYSYFATQLHHRVCYRAFLSGFRCKFVAMIFFCILYLFSFGLRWILLDDLGKTGGILKIVQFMTMYNDLHIIFYIDALGFYMKQLNLVMARDSLNAQHLLMPSAMSHLKSRLKAYKNVHFRFWLASQHINRFFEFSLTPLVLQLLNAFSFAVFRIFRLFYDGKPIFSIWRNASQMKFKSLSSILLNIYFPGSITLLASTGCSFLTFVYVCNTLGQQVSFCPINYVAHI